MIGPVPASRWRSQKAAKHIVAVRDGAAERDAREAWRFCGSIVAR
jgi:hypothetical protein